MFLFAPCQMYYLTDLIKLDHSILYYITIEYTSSYNFSKIYMLIRIRPTTISCDFI